MVEADYRPVPEDRREDQRRVARYAFDAVSGPYEPGEVDEHTRRRWDFGVRRGMFAGGDLLACCAHVEFEARLRGRWLPLAGLTGVATRPDRRGEGLAGAMVEASLAEYRREGWPLSALRPFEEAYYARYGYATGYRYDHVTVDPGALPADGGASDGGTTDGGEFRQVRRPDAPELAPAYRAWLDGVELATRRTDRWWRDRVFRTREGEPYCHALLRDGAVRGYLVYEFEDGADGRRLRVHELAHADHAAFRSLLAFCRDHASQVERVAIGGPTAGRVGWAVDDRDAVEVTRRPGHMVRVVDVTTALEAVPYPGVGTAEVVLDVADDAAPWNDGRFRLRVRDGAATVDPADGAAPDARLDVGTLSALLVGARPVEHAQAAGDLDADDAAAGTLADLFPERTTYLPEAF